MNAAMLITVASFAFCSATINAFYTKFEGNQCWGTATDILRDFEGTAEECAAKCNELTDCVGFIRVNSGSGFAGMCYFRGGALRAPYEYNRDDRDCYVPDYIRFGDYLKFEGQQCWGTATDILRDFEGTAEECAAKCDELEYCVGFIRVNSGSRYAGMCYFRGGALEDPYEYTGDDRDCYAPASLDIADYTKFEGQQCWGSATDILRDFEGTAKECATKCNELEDCVGFIRVNSGSGFAGMCYFRGGSLEKPYEYDGDDRDCYAPNSPGSSAKQLPVNNDLFGNAGEYKENYMEIMVTTQTGLYIFWIVGVLLVINCICLGYYVWSKGKSGMNRKRYYKVRSIETDDEAQ